MTPLLFSSAVSSASNRTSMACNCVRSASRSAVAAARLASSASRDLVAELLYSYSNHPIETVKTKVSPTSSAPSLTAVLGSNGVMLLTLYPAPHIVIREVMLWYDCPIFTSTCFPRSLLDIWCWICLLTGLLSVLMIKPASFVILE